MTTALTVEELLGLPVVVDIPTAGRAFGLGRDAAYRLAARDALPVPVLRLGRRMLVTRASLASVLGLDVPPGNALSTGVNAQVSGVAPDCQTTASSA